MADEFIADIGGGHCPSIREVERAISSSGRYVVERSTADQIALRLSIKNRRPNWPEDFTLSYREHTILLTIHSATKQERAEIVRDVESILRQFGDSVVFESV